MTKDKKFILTDVVNRLCNDPLTLESNLSGVADYVGNIAVMELQGNERDNALKVQRNLNFGKMNKEDQEFLKTLGINVQPAP